MNLGQLLRETLEQDSEQKNELIAQEKAIKALSPAKKYLYQQGYYQNRDFHYTMNKLNALSESKAEDKAKRKRLANLW